jgi:O-antigen/teichoic acid export membrane protein
VEEINVATIKERAVRGIVVLTGRTFLLQILSTIALFLLFQYLAPSEYGVFVIVSSVVNFLVYFSDIGLAAALIQKKELPTDTDLKTTFTVQQFLVFSLVLILFLLTPFLVSKYSLTNDGKNLIYALGISLILSSFKSIPSVLLERKLEFVKLVFPQILEQVVYNILLVFLAMKGFGLKSFSISIVVRGIVGLVAIYMLQPWKIGFAFSFKSLKDLFKFGIPYQINTFIATLKDDGVIIVLGGIIGPAGIGILSFAQKVARLPLTFFMDTVTKVTFPAFSRLQDKKQDLERSVTRSIFFICLLVFPSLVGIIVLMPWIIDLVPKYSKWSTAIIPLIFISINFAFAAGTTQLTNVLNAIGKIKITFYLMIMWTVLTWILVPFLAFKFGVNGASVGYGLVGFSSIVAILVTKKYVNFSIYDSMIKPLIASLIMFLCLIFIKKYLAVNFYSVGILTLAGVITYGVSIVTMIGVSLIEDAKKSFKTIFKTS